MPAAYLLKSVIRERGWETRKYLTTDGCCMFDRWSEEQLLVNAQGRKRKFKEFSLKPTKTLQLILVADIVRISGHCQLRCSHSSTKPAPTQNHGLMRDYIIKGTGPYLFKNINGKTIMITSERYRQLLRSFCFCWEHTMILMPATCGTALSAWESMQLLKNGIKPHSIHNYGVK